MQGSLPDQGIGLDPANGRDRGIAHVGRRRKEGSTATELEQTDPGAATSELEQTDPGAATYELEQGGSGSLHAAV